LLFLACYPNLREIAERYKNNSRYSIILLNVIISCLLFSFFLPHIISSSKYGFLNHKIVEKNRLCESLLNRKKILLVTSIVSRYCPDDSQTGILQINKDAEDVSSFMRTLPNQLTFTGPSWLRYKAGKNISFTKTDSSLYLYSKDIRYLKWEKQNEIYEVLYDGIIKNKITPLEFNAGMRSIGAYFFFLEKFRIETGPEKTQKFKKLNVNLENFPVIFENNSFAIIKSMN